MAKFHPITNPTPKGSRSPRNFLQAKRAKFPHGTGSSEVASQISLAHGGTARALMVALGMETSASAADLTIEQGAVYVFGEGGLRKYR